VALEIWQSRVDAHTLLAEKVYKQRRWLVVLVKVSVALLVIPHAIDIGIKEIYYEN
jgi:hypothetical protein